MTAPPARRRRPRFVNVVPTPATRALAARLVRQTRDSTAAEAVLANVDDIAPDQYAALLAAVLTSTKAHDKLGRPREPLQLTEEERRRGYSQYRQGERTEFACVAYREYQRVMARRYRDRQKNRRDSGAALRPVAG
ncbi:hypothetical protein [Nocardioides sp. Leaf374]|uniref:hypothetical protein n=1 Tax=Nocardioides sp. Leaf374 TaxID=2876560 RepID=UPI001E409CD3|nr:hypothetical protein [Nocardioides sp. Leaf374]